MQSTRSRVALILAAIAIVVVAFVVLNPGGEEEDDPVPTTAADEAPQDDAGDGRSSGGEPGPARQPQVPVVEIENGGLVGGVKEIEAESGERVEFEVRSDTPDEIHVHGYELTKEVAPGDPARFSFTADAEGIYEVEAHDIGHVVVAELRVGSS